MSRERLDLPIDRDSALRHYDDLREEVGIVDPAIAAPRIGIPLEDLERYLRSRQESNARLARMSV